MKNIALLFVLAALPAAAAASETEQAAPRLEPLTGSPPHPADNPPTPEKIALGRALFFDNILSGAPTRSCSTCHKPELYFTDGFSRGWGLNETQLRRKTPNLLNVGWQRSMFFDGRVDTLEQQAPEPLKNPVEMDLQPGEAAARVRADNFYRQAFEIAFPGEPITFELIAKAIASYERTLVSYDSNLDRYLLGDEKALSPEAQRGLALFTGKARCIACHHGPMLTDHQKHYTGVHENRGDNQPGTKYKTQSLRDVMRRYSYMHNGDMLTISDVLDHYEAGGAAPEGLEAEIAPVDLSDAERDDLTAFLRSLNGRVGGLLDHSPQHTDVFNIQRDPPVTAADEEAAAQDPNYLRPQDQEGPVQDPNYVPKKLR